MEESFLISLMMILIFIIVFLSYEVVCVKKKNNYKKRYYERYGETCGTNGICGDPYKCTGTLQKGLCPGGKDNVCCISTSTSSTSSTSSSATPSSVDCKTDWFGYSGKCMSTGSTCTKWMDWDAENASCGSNVKCCISGYAPAPSSSSSSSSSSSFPVPVFSTSSSLTWTSLPADVPPGKKVNVDGYTSTQLRSDIAPFYKALYNEVHSLGGLITSAGGKRPLDAKVTAGRSATSLHYIGRAFDMALPTGMQNVDTDQFICVPIDSKHWTVWCKSTSTSVPIVTLTGTTVKSGKTSTKSWTGRAFNFTALASKYGFSSIGARSCFPSTYTCGEWWHFQYVKDLSKGITFGSELLKLYSLSTLEKTFPAWSKSKDLQYGISWW